MRIFVNSVVMKVALKTSFYSVLHDSEMVCKEEAVISSIRKAAKKSSLVAWPLRPFPPPPPRA